MSNSNTVEEKQQGDGSSKAPSGFKTGFMRPAFVEALTKNESEDANQEKQAANDNELTDEIEEDVAATSEESEIPSAKAKLAKSSVLAAPKKSPYEISHVSEKSQKLKKKKNSLAPAASSSAAAATTSKSTTLKSSTTTTTSTSPTKKPVPVSSEPAKNTSRAVEDKKKQKPATAATTATTATSNSSSISPTKKVKKPVPSSNTTTNNTSPTKKSSSATVAKPKSKSDFVSKKGIYASFPTAIIRKMISFLDLRMENHLDFANKTKKQISSILIKNFYGRFPDKSLHLVYICPNYEFPANVVMMLLPVVPVGAIRSNVLFQTPYEQSEVPIREAETRKFLEANPAYASSVTQLELSFRVSKDMAKVILNHLTKLKKLRVGERLYGKRALAQPEVYLPMDEEISNLIAEKLSDSLEEIEWKGEGLETAEAQAVGNVKHLKSLKVIHNKNIQAYSGLLTNLAKNPTLENLEIRNEWNKAPARPAAATTPSVMETLLEFPDLKYLTMDSFPLSQFPIIGGCQSLCYLDLSRATLDTECFSAIGVIPNLRVLLLNEIKGEKLDDLQYLIPLNDTLQVLSIESSTFCADESCVKYISQFTNLKSLWLQNAHSGARTTNAGVRAIAANLKQLEEIDVANSDITELSVVMLVKHCPQLTFIGIDSCVKVIRKSLNQQQAKVTGYRENRPSYIYGLLTGKFNPKFLME